MAKQVALYRWRRLIALLKVIEYKHFVREYPSEVYGGLVALIFTAIGICFGLRWTRAKEVVVIREMPVRMDGPFVLNAEKLKESLPEVSSLAEQTRAHIGCDFVCGQIRFETAFEIAKLPGS